ncbi:complex III assembly factor LYRM7 isoform X2 [Platichthys flesus]|uniref:complex III assembly factor LYRM7 isoform X2 n=1 Tax=Platichthys flesus TaxID=8260 RepID=UPI002DB9A81A|nr:complex III assembly factor LYRM7 isoform X2 [Platichthys flesus]
MLAQMRAELHRTRFDYNNSSFLQIRPDWSRQIYFLHTGSVFQEVKMGTRVKVLSVFKALHRTRQTVFKDDNRALADDQNGLRCGSCYSADRVTDGTCRRRHAIARTQRGTPPRKCALL